MYVGFCSIVLKQFFANCLSALANVLRPKHDRGDENFAYRVLDSCFQLSCLLFGCLFLPLRGFFPRAGMAARMCELLSAALVRALNLEISVTANLASVCLHDANHACMHEPLFALAFSLLMPGRAAACSCIVNLEH